jgi:EipB-like
MAVHQVFASRSVIVACALFFAASAVVRAQDGPIVLVPHRAVYDLTLGRARDTAQVAAVRGRILYDFDGNACEGYTLQFRQVSELDSGEGKVSTSDLRSSTWEGGDSKRFKFTSQNFLDQNLVDSVDGHAEHGTGATAINLAKPEQKALDIDAAVVFPTQHMVRVIEAARAGKTVLDFPVFDGSDTGDKVYNTLTVIGRKLTADDRKHDDAAAAEPKLAEVPRWPITISYFEKSKTQKSTEQTPVYAISFELYENGISRALSLDYNDFVVAGKLSSLEVKQPKPCP